MLNAEAVVRNAGSSVKIQTSIPVDSHEIEVGAVRW